MTNNPQSNKIPVGVKGGFFIYEATDAEKILWADGNVIELFGCKNLEELRDYTRNSFSGMVFPEDLPKIKNTIQSQTMYGERRHDYVRYRITPKTGGLRYVEDFGHLLRTEDGKSYFYVFMVDVEQSEYFNRAKNSYAEAQIFVQNLDTDSLTGLYNMSQFYQKVQVIITNPENRKKGINFIHFDVANFKLFNERYGFTKGDELLCQVARIIRKTFPEHLVARFSNDHFVVCAEGNKESIIAKIDQIYKMNDVKKVQDSAGTG